MDELFGVEPPVDEAAGEVEAVAGEAVDDDARSDGE